MEEEEARRGCSRKRGPDPTRAQRSGQRYYYKSNEQTRKQASQVTFLKAQRPILAAVQEKMGSWRDGLWEPEDLLGSHCVMQGETEMPRPAVGMNEVQGAEDAVTTGGGAGREVRVQMTRRSVASGETGLGQDAVISPG